MNNCYIIVCFSINNIRIYFKCKLNFICYNKCCINLIIIIIFLSFVNFTLATSLGYRVLLITVTCGYHSGGQTFHPQGLLLATLLCPVLLAYTFAFVLVFSIPVSDMVVIVFARNTSSMYTDKRSLLI